MTEGEATAELRRAVGENGFLEHPPLEVDGLELSTTLRPPDVEMLASSLRVLSQHRMAVLVRGGGTALACGNLLRRADAVLDTRGLAGIELLDAEEGVVCVGAGTDVAQLAEASRDAGWEAPLDPPRAGATVGGCLAAASVGPRFGHPRDAVLGLEVVLATGERTRCGGRVVKNVTGYDLAKIYTGSFGSLAVITSAWLRLRAQPEYSCVLTAPLGLDAAGLALGLAAGRLATGRVAALMGATRTNGRSARADEAPSLLVELAGEEPAVRVDREWLVSATGAREVGEEALARVRALQAGPEPEAGLRLRIAGLPSRLPQALAELGGLAGERLAYPARGLLFASLVFDAHAPPDERVVDEWMRAARRAARLAEGHLVLESSPAWGRASRDVFGDVGAPLALHRALKARFDPTGVLNPGRFVGGL